MYQVGEFYNILCWVYYDPVSTKEVDEDIIWRDEIDYNSKSNKLFYLKEQCIPLIDHLHNDIENGQLEKHYHINTRFFITVNNPLAIVRVDFPLKFGKLEYRKLQCINEIEILPTKREFISKSKLKHKCIYKGKCPHRGFDLSNEVPILEEGINSEWVIKCPLHSLKFNANTKKLINE